MDDPWITLAHLYLTASNQDQSFVDKLSRLLPCQGTGPGLALYLLNLHLSVCGCESSGR